MQRSWRAETAEWVGEDSAGGGFFQASRWMKVSFDPGLDGGLL